MIITEIFWISLSIKYATKSKWIFIPNQQIPKGASHLIQTTRNLVWKYTPFCLVWRICRIVKNAKIRTAKLSELKTVLTNQKHSNETKDAGIKKAREILVVLLRAERNVSETYTLNSCLYLILKYSKNQKYHQKPSKNLKQ